MNKIIALKNIQSFTDCLEDKFFLCYGTSLGANREKDIISHDLDVDIGIMRADFKLEYINAIIEKGFKLIRLYGTLECGLELSFRKDGIKIDLMVYYQTGNIIWNSLWNNGGVNGLSDMIVHSYEVEKFDISYITLGNLVMPSLGIEYIISVYGENWRTPVTQWDWRCDHLCRDDALKNKLLNIYGK